jgi:hypothetical protein
VGIGVVLLELVQKGRLDSSCIIKEGWMPIPTGLLLAQFSSELVALSRLEYSSSLTLYYTFLVRLHVFEGYSFSFARVRRQLIRFLMQLKLLVLWQIVKADSIVTTTDHSVSLACFCLVQLYLSKALLMQQIKLVINTLPLLLLPIEILEQVL